MRTKFARLTAPKSLGSRVFNFFQIGSPDECWPWQGARNMYGYGKIGDHGKTLVAPRVLWEMVNGETIPEGLVVRHSCDNPPCVNPNHLLLGTYAENSADMVARERHVSANERNAQRRREWTVCKQGHLYADVGFVVTRGARRCRECARLTARRKYYRNKELRMAS